MPMDSAATVKCEILRVLTAHIGADWMDAVRGMELPSKLLQALLKPPFDRALVQMIVDETNRRRNAAAPLNARTRPL